MSQTTLDPHATLPLRSDERRIYGRFQLPVSVMLEARWRGRTLPLTSAPEQENISAVGAAFCLARGPLPPLGEALEIRIPLLGRPRQPARLYAQCRGRVVRHDGGNRLAVFFEDIDFQSDGNSRPQTLSSSLEARQ